MGIRPQTAKRTRNKQRTRSKPHAHGRTATKTPHAAHEHAMKSKHVNSCGHAIGEGHHRARFTDADIEMILMLRFELRLTYREIQAKFDDMTPPPARSTIGDVCRGVIRAQVPYGSAPVKRRT